MLHGEKKDQRKKKTNKLTNGGPAEKKLWGRTEMSTGKF